jgi:cathepsin L
VADYPYTATEGTCKFNAEKGVNKIASYQWGEQDEGHLQQMIGTIGVALVGIDATPKSFQLYSSGIYNEPECLTSFLTHAVGCVGYGTEGSTPYWIVRNSWGSTWGESGYIRMSRNRDNQCGIATASYIPIVA